MLKKLSTLSKSVKSFLFYNLFYIRKNYKIKDEKYAVVNVDIQIKDDDLCRYFYIICLYFRKAGFKVIVKADWRDFKNFKTPFDFKKLLLKEKYIFVRNCSTPVNTITLVQPGATDRTVHFSYGYTIAQSGDFDCIANYPMYPVQFESHSNLMSTARFESERRIIRVFFAGDTNEIKYGSEQITKFFNVIPRVEVVRFVLSTFKNSRKLQGDQGKLILEKLLSSNGQKEEIIISEVKSKEKEWLKILSKTDFFICPPGVRIPWSHNCIEAMSVGSIPILQYSNLFNPHLEHMKNCLSYSNYSELKEAIEKAVSMEQSEIETMRINVMNYYKEYLSVDSILKRIKTFSNSTYSELKVAIPFIPTKKEWRLQIGLYNPTFLKQIGLLHLHSRKSQTL